MIDNEKLLLDITAHIKEKYGCHTILLYGSYVTGDHTNESDIDLIGFTNLMEQYNEVGLFKGKQLDVWIHPTSDMNNYDQFLKLDQAEILLDEHDKASPFIENVQRVFADGPEKLSLDEKVFLRRWLQKMEKRSRKGDLEGNYRFHWMLKESLEIYFELNGRWYLGPKKSFTWLKENDSEGYYLIQKAFNEPNEHNHVSKWIDYLTT
ncbi:nucleotidyltransferase domain-containing protein [Bacillus sp. 2205SS5-2]|uniref:nucleotidyltransferase domain-containing protein n=1 Tax=Bacillus sp. 2205SS5-2 TaxID=3109031 RepID=UPI00300606F0